MFPDSFIVSLFLEDREAKIVLYRSLILCQELINLKNFSYLMFKHSTYLKHYEYRNINDKLMGVHFFLHSLPLKVLILLNFGYTTRKYGCKEIQDFEIRET